MDVDNKALLVEIGIYFEIFFFVAQSLNWWRLFQENENKIQKTTQSYYGSEVLSLLFSVLLVLSLLDLWLFAIKI